ncbi:hypothetical protein [Larkinella rosea]|uniref:O-antigen polysaccharide polymerase Wzy n=1 Tax=Larkinella rosea TaxID=2025312 RepID=A0A3P1BTB6_9BACT|nr:hypothetical protein [Larkinella rosea]RRB04262.1 hypothetical protein EHT25_12145 [Larkinella rosea]
MVTSQPIQFGNTPATQLPPVQQRFIFLGLFKKWIWGGVLVAALLQGLFFFTFENVFAIACVLFAWRLADKFVLTAFNLAKYTFSTVILLGFSLTQYVLPLIFTLLEGKPITYNLKFPYSVFIHSLLALLVFITAHYFYKEWREGFAGKLYYKLSGFLNRNYFFTTPPDLQIWIIGFVGLAGMAVTYLTGNHFDGTAEERGTVAKFFQGLVPYAYTPLFLLLKPLFSRRSGPYKRPVLKVLVFAAMLLFVGMGGNSRGLFMTGISAVGISYLIGLLLGKFNHDIFNIKTVLLAGLGLWIITGPLADLGTSMVIVRGQRSHLNSTELVLKTLEVFQNKKAIKQFRAMNTVIEVRDWDETYFDNIFLSRFCNLKYNDASLELAYKLGKPNADMLDYSIDKFWAILPLPVLNFLHIKVDKLTVNASSYGDYLYYRAGGKGGLGGFRTGHFAGTGLATFGWWYLLLLGVGVIPLFLLVDGFVLYYQQGTTMNTCLSLAGLIQMNFFFTLFSVSNFSESAVNIYAFLMRGWIQDALLYWFILFVLRKLRIG